MNKTQRLHREIMGELMQHLSKNDAEYFANWLLTHYKIGEYKDCLLYTSPSPRDGLLSRMPSSA